MIIQLALLAARCEHFRASFGGAFVESLDNVVEISDCSPEVFQMFLDYIYTDNVNITHEHAVDLLIFASEYIIPRLVNLCEDFIRASATVDTICDIWMVTRY